jgi:protease-4
MNTLNRPPLQGLIFLVLGLATFFGGLLIWTSLNESGTISDGVCNIAVIPIYGQIVAFASEDERSSYVYTVTDETLELLNRAEQDPNIVGILVQIDSSGGSPAAAIELTERLQEIEMPVAAYIRDVGASAAYFIATGADTIIASPVADVGSIGVSMSYLQNTLQNREEGLEFITLSTGKFKDSGDPNKPLTEEERALFERDLEISHQFFVDSVARNRNIPADAVSVLADGSTMSASLALNARLIDSVGSKLNVREWFVTALESSAENVVLCPPAAL